MFGLQYTLSDFDYIFHIALPSITGVGFFNMLINMMIGESFFFLIGYYALLATWIYVIFRKEKVVLWSALLLLIYLILHSFYFYNAFQSF